MQPIRPTSRRRFIWQSSALTASALFASRLRLEAASRSALIPDDLLYTSTKKLAERIRSKEISAVELVQAYIDRIEAVNPSLNAVVFPCYERALMEAKQADRSLAAGKNHGALHGVPCTMKDSHDTAGVLSTGGTLGRKDHVPGKDATYVQRLRDAGAIVLGKTNTPELTLSGQTTNLIYGKTHNPYKIGYQPGGSTGGGASIVAAGGSPFDIGTDFGGSIRGPAHFCGITGLKPQYGRVPRTGHIVDYGGYFDPFQVVGPLARWVEDLELITPLIAGPDYRDAAIIPVPWQDAASVDLKSIKVAFYIENGSEDPCSPETVAAMRRVLALFEDLGVSIVEDAPLDLIKESDDLRRALSGADGREWVKRLLRKYGTTQVAPNINISGSADTDTKEFTRLVEAMDHNRSKFLQWVDAYDLVICPTNRTAAQPWPDEPSSGPDGKKNYPYMSTYNNTGWPGTVVRAGTSAEGLPIGIQLITKPWREDISLAAAYFVEAGTGGYQKPTI